MTLLEKGLNFILSSCIKSILFKRKDFIVNTVKKEAFTLIEILIAIALIALLIGTMGPKLIDYLKSGKKRSAQMHLKQIKDGLIKYDLDVTGIPKTIEQLKSNVEGRENWDGPYIKEDLRDPWGEEYVYNKPPQEFTGKYKKYEIFSFGPDGEGSDKSTWIHDGE
jgi:general secretion pathway protein G